MEGSSSTAQQNSPQGNTNDQVSDDVNPLTTSLTEESDLILEEMENSQNSRQGNINVDPLTLSLKEEFKQLHPISRERCIYRVQKRLKDLNEKAYTPRCVSIGPYHHGKDELMTMEEHKIMYLQYFLEFSSLNELVLCVRKNETKLRNCYQERIDLSSEIFVRLMLVDAVFVIMVMLRSALESREDETLSSPLFQFCNEDELLFNKPRMLLDIRKDMILLENQLPFFILKLIFDLSNLVSKKNSMIKLSYDFLDSEFTSWMAKEKNKQPFPSEELDFSESKHLVDFLRIRQRPLEKNKHKQAKELNFMNFLRIRQQPLEKNKHKQAKELNFMNFPSAVKLHRAGVKFQRGSNLRLVDIKFHKGTLEIPPLTIEDPTEILFRNVQAFEQSHLYNDERYFNDYIIMIGLLVTNGEDVEILTKERIIENLLLDNEEVAHLLHNLAKENDFNTKNFYFTDLVNNLNRYCRKRRNRWRASLIQNHFQNPWLVISLIGATLLLLLTIVQAICSFLQVKQQQ